jgi:hypothetical protein
MRLDFLSLNLYICKRMSLTGHKYTQTHTPCYVSTLFLVLVVVVLFLSLSFSFSINFNFNAFWFLIFLCLQLGASFIGLSLSYFLFILFYYYYLLLHPPGQQNYQIHLIFLVFYSDWPPFVWSIFSICKYK